MENIMDILHITNKGKMLNTLEKFHIYKETKIDNQINDKCTIRLNNFRSVNPERHRYRAITTITPAIHHNIPQSQAEAQSTCTCKL